MKIMVDTEVFKRLLSQTVLVVKERAINPVLQCAKFTAEDGELTIEGTNLEHAIRATTDMVDVLEKGVATIPCRRLLEIVGVIDDPTLTIVVKKGAAEIKSKSGVFTLSCHKPDDFPVFPNDGMVLALTIKCDEFARGIALTLPAVGEDTRWNTKCLLIDGADKITRLIGATGRCMVIVRTGCDWKNTVFPKAMIPPSAAQIVAKLCATAEKDAMCALSVSENMARFEIGGVEFTTTIMEGSYPAYESICVDGKVELEAETGELVAAMNRASLLTDNLTPGVTCSFEGLNHQIMQMRGQINEIGNSFVDMELLKTKGEPFVFRLNPDQWMRTARMLNGVVKMRLDGPGKPMEMRFGDDVRIVQSLIAM